MITSYYSRYILEKGTTVTNNDLNSLLQEVREINDSFYLIETITKSNHWFKPTEEVVTYTLISDIYGDYSESHDTIDCQIINIGKTERDVKTYFYGFLAGNKSN